MLKFVLKLFVSKIGKLFQLSKRQMLMFKRRQKIRKRYLVRSGGEKRSGNKKMLILTLIV